MAIAVVSHRNILQRTLTVTAILALAASTAGFVWQQQPERSQTRGALQVEGIRDRIQIRRDRDGVPHIGARSENDALLGLGYAHAQDRLWQMEFQRRLGNGRLAEILGEPALNTDRLFRTVGLNRVAASAWANLNAQERQLIESYVAGINAYLNNRHNRQLPPEFNILGIEPEPWRPEDVLVWSKVVAWSLSENWDEELLRVQMLPHLGAEKTAQLMPAYTADGPTILPSSRRQSAVHRRSSVDHAQHSLIAYRSPLDLLALNRTIEEQLGLGADGFGSNNWVLSGTRTKTGKPILANDPHLGAQTPSIWYLAHITGGGLDVIGATIPGVPGVQIGHNGHISWRVTSINVDSQDVYMERINERNEAEYKGAWEPLTIVPETIKVKGQSEINLNVRISRHGPLISDVVNPAGPALALRWTGNDPEDSGILAGLRIDRARNWHEFTDTFRAHRAGDQNYVYADQRGNIGYIAVATIPMRAKGDGTLPVPGWTGEHEWTGYVPFDELPQTFNPPEGYIASAKGMDRSDGAGLRMLWQSTRQGLRCRWVHSQTQAGPTFRPAAVDAHERNRRWRLAMTGRAAV